jgi:hypothetical protein
VTDRAVQPEAPTTKAGRVLLEQEAYNSRSFPLITVEAIVAIEAEARAASQERPQPRKVPVSDDFRPPPRPHPLDHIATPAGVAQERPPIDVPPHPFIEVQRSPTHCLLFIEGGTCKQPPNAPIHGGGSVASPEPSDG